MISVQEALSIIKKHQYTAKAIQKPLAKCLGYTIANDIFSPIAMPPFRQSAMDGYAVCLHDVNRYNLIGEVKAGDAANYILNPGQAVRIFTGAEVPDSANAVIMQEKVERNETSITLIEQTIKVEQNIRPKGEQIQQGNLALSKDTVLTPSSISYLSSLGINSVNVYPKPKVAIVVTGSELIPPGQEYQQGKIYESNSIMLSTTLQQENIEEYSIHRVKDDYDSTEKLLKQVIDTNDFVLVSGGISVGDYDFVGKALRAINTKELFYKIKQKPGKPLFFGKNNSTYIFALPGNPASALTCFYMYALPMIRTFSKHSKPHLEWTLKKLSHDYIVKGIRAQFLKANYTNDQVEILGLQSSAMVHGFNNANSLVFIPENSSKFNKNTKIEVILLP